MADLEFSTMASSKKLFAGDWYYDLYRKWRGESKPEIVLSKELRQSGSKFRRQIWVYSITASSKIIVCPGTTAIATGDRKLQCVCQNRKYFYLWNYDVQNRYSSGESGFLATTSSTKVCPSNFDNDRYPEMEADFALIFSIFGCPLLSESLPLLLSSSWSKIPD